MTEENKNGQNNDDRCGTADTNEKYKGGLRIKAENMLKINLNGQTIACGMICYVSRGGRNIARIYTHPDDYDTKIKELREENRFFVAYQMVLNERQRAGEAPQNDLLGNNNLFGTGTPESNGTPTLN